MQAEPIATVAQRHPLEAGASFRTAPAGQTLAEIVAAHDLPPRYGLPVVVLIRGREIWPVPADLWHRVRPRPGTRVEIGYPVQGGALAFVGSALLAQAGPWVAGTLFGLTAGTLAYSLTVAAVTIVGGLALQALIPPPPQPEIPERGERRFVITGTTNQTTRYGIYPKVLGRHRMFPVQTASGFSETVGRDEVYFYGRMTFGWGPVALEDLRIGTTPITQFEGIELEFVNVDETETLALSPELGPITRAWRSLDARLELYPDDIAEDSYNAGINDQGETVVRTTRDRTESVGIDITFPNGLFDIHRRSGRVGRQSARFEIAYRALGDTTWTVVTEPTYTAASISLQRFTVDVALPAPGEYEIRVTRLDQEVNSPEKVSTAFLSAIRSRRSGKLPSHANIAEVAFRLKASEELNGRVQTLSAIVHQMAPVWDGSAWSAPQRVRHPAWIYLDAIRGAHLSRPVADDRIDLAAFKAWAEEEPHWTCDHVIETEQRLAEVLDLIAATGRAKRALTDLRYSVIRDQAAGPIRQVFTPRNSWGFRGEVTFPREIHGFRVQVTSERLDWERDEIRVFRAPYDETTATAYETLDLPGVVITAAEADQGNAWRLARYQLAQAVLRPETWEWRADWEAIRVTRGDLVQLVHDVPLMGVGAGRITALETDGTTLLSLTLDETLEVGAESHRLTLRSSDGTRHVITAVSADGQTWTWESGAVEATAIGLGDLVLVETLTQESVKALVTGIYPEMDGSARITAVPAAPEVLEAATGTIPAYQPSVTAPVGNPAFGPPLPDVIGLVSDQTTVLRERGGGLQARAGVRVAPVVGRTDPGRYLQTRWRVAETAEWHYGDFQPATAAVVHTGPLVTGETYDVEVRRIGEVSAYRGWAPAGQVLAQTSDLPPPDVLGWQATPSEGQVQMRWDDPGVLDLSHLEIRYTSGTTAAWNASTLLSKVPYPKLTEQVFARAGTYMAKWVDRGGAQSATPAVATVTTAQLAAANAVETREAHPDWTGTFDGTEVTGIGELQLAPDGTGAYPLEGSWTMGSAVDLGAVYPVRITPNLAATAFSPSDTMATWPVLTQLDTLAPSNPDAWGLDIEVATSASDPSGGTDWRALTGGDYIGRYFTFRVRLRTTRTDTTPRVTALDFVLDMPDRLEGADAVASGTGGLSIPFTPPFRVAPAIVITPRDLPAGGRYAVTGQSRAGFTVEFFDSGGTSIDVMFDWVARGYGRETT